MTPQQYLQAFSSGMNSQMQSPFPQQQQNYDNQSQANRNDAIITGNGVFNYHNQSNSSQQNQNQVLDEQRRQDILLKLQQEREMRRKFVQEGKSNEFKLETLSSARQNQNPTLESNQNYQNKQQQQQQHSNNYLQRESGKFMNNEQDNGSNYSQSFDKRQQPTPQNFRIDMLNDNESQFSGFSGHNNALNPTQNQAFHTLSHQYNLASRESNQGVDGQQDLVNKLLQERRASRSKQNSTLNHSVNHQIDNSSNNMNDQQQPYVQFNQESANQSQISPNGLMMDEGNVGGFNPEALYQEDVVKSQYGDLENDEDNFQNQQYLQQPFQSFTPQSQFQKNMPIQNQRNHQQQLNPSGYNYSAQNQSRDHWLNQTNQSSQQSQGGTPSVGAGIDDQKYRDAVEYAKFQIQQELKKKQQLNQKYQNNDFIDSYPSDRIHNVIQNAQQNKGGRGNSKDQVPEPERRQPRPSESHQSTITQNYMDFNNGQGLPPSVKQMDKNITNQSLNKTHQEMNKKTQQRTNKQGGGGGTHHFNYESEDDQKQRINGLGGTLINKPESGANNFNSDNFHRPQTVKATRTSTSQGPPEYMRNTVNADLKKGNQATVSKTKQLVTEAERKFKEECTFKPQINDYQVAPSKEFSKEERWKKLTEPKTSEIQKREIIKAQIEQIEALQTCPFKPQIQKSAKKSARKPARETDPSLPLPERLMHEADVRKEKREKLKREMDQHQMKDCSFKPQLMTTSNSVVNINKFNNVAPIHERVNSLQKEKNEKLQKLRMQSEQDQSDKLTFHPQVNQKSSKITTVKRMEEDTRPRDVVERLYQDAAQRIDKQLNHTESIHDQLNRDCSFQPHISKTSNYLSEKSDLFNGNLKDFYQRQEAFQQRQQEKRQEHQQKYSQEAQCSFKPEINVTSDIIMESDPKRGAETEEERYYRLYKKDMKRQEIVKEMIEKEVYQQYTFKPQINKISKTLARGSSIDELAYNPKGQLKREQLQEEMVSKEVNYCTFRPETTKSKKYENIESTYKFNDCESLEQFSLNLKQKLKEKQEKIAKVRKEREYEQQRDCTFKPQVLEKETSTSKDQVVVVRGLGRHLELKELQKKKEEDKKLREAEVFGLNHKFAVNAEELDITNPNRDKAILAQASSVNQSRLNQTNNGNGGAYTVAQPFELSQSKLEKKSKLLKELNDRERQECTFKPSTNEGRNRQLIKEILEETEDKENDPEFSQEHVNYYN